MGLCKCEKKKVTNQFCFEHRVNVCENCMVTHHTKCVIQSYLQWLNDSDYNPVCQLCQEELVTDECTRLVCYDIFHKSCLADWARRLPPNTAPAGYNCPVCSSNIFPAPNLVSPVADALRIVLQSYDWARIGLDLPFVQTTSIDNSVTTSLAKLEQSTIEEPNGRGIPDGYDPTLNTTEALPPKEDYNPELTSGVSQHRSAASVSTGITRKVSDSSSIVINDEDTGDSKYKRRPAFEWFNRWLRTFHRPSSRHHQGIIGGRRRMILIITIVAIFSFIAWLSYIRTYSGNDDPMFDPMNNPNIRVNEE